MRLSPHLRPLPGALAGAVLAITGLLHAEDPLAVTGNWRFGSLTAVNDGGGTLNINAAFVAKPWTEYVLFATEDFSSWVPLGQAPETNAGEFFFHDSSGSPRRFYHAQITPPGTVKTLDAHYYGRIASQGAAAHRYGLAYNAETNHAIAGALLDLGRGIEQATQALLGVVNVVDLQNGSFQVSWAGNQQIANGAAARDAAVQNFQQQRTGTQMQLGQAQGAVGRMHGLRRITQAANPLAIEEAAVLDCEFLAISTHLPLPVGPVFLPHDAPLAGMDLDKVSIEKRAAEKERAALEQRIARLRQEATRKRQLAAAAPQVFGIGGTWFVRWANVELTFPTQAQAQNDGVNQVNGLKSQRLAEADALDAEADALQGQVPAMTAKITALCATGAALAATYQGKLAAHPGGVTNPVDTAKPQPKWRAWIEFPPEYTDRIWEEIYREWQAGRDSLRQKLIAAGAAQSEIDALLKRYDDDAKPRRRFMNTFCGEPIKLKFLTINQFTGFDVDTAGAKWYVEYQNMTTMQFERVEVGTGGELCLTPEQAKQIYQHARAVQNEPGQEVLITIAVRYDRVYPDGKRVTDEQRQQIAIDGGTRAERDAIHNNLPR